MNPIFLSFTVYFCFLLIIGLACRRKQTSAADFIVGGRSLNYWVTALSAHASDMSSWLFLGLPAVIYTGGLAKGWIAVGLLIGMFLNWHLVAPRLRVVTEQYNCFTLSDYFAQRFDDKTGYLRLITATLILVFMCGYLAAGFMGIGTLFENYFHFSYTLGILLASGVIMLYVGVGGYVAVAWTDFFQALFLLAAIMLVPAIAYQSTPATWQPDLSWQPDLEGLLEAAAWGLGYFGMPHILTKFMGLRDPKEMGKAKWVGMSWQLLSLMAACAVAIVATGYFPETLANPQVIFIEMVNQLFHPFFAGLILCGFLAATISTMDSQLLVVSGVLAEDFYKRLFHKNATDKQLLLASRVGLVCVMLAGIAIAVFGRDIPINKVVFYCWSGFGSGFGPLVLLSLLVPSMSRKAAYATLIVGASVGLFWHLLGTIVPGPVVSFALCPLIVALMRNKK